MRRWRDAAAAVLISGLVASPVAGQALPRLPRTDDSEIHIDAEQISYDKKTDTVHAHGQVVITRGETELRADDVVVNRTTNEAEASGNVMVTDPEGVMLAEHVRLNLEDETGVLVDASLRASRVQYSLAGERMEKGIGQTYHIENGKFTTCRCSSGPPSWSISGKELRVTDGGYGHLRGGTFNIMDVPIAYLPRALFPVQRERQSGFLIPRFGASNRRGFQTVLPFYWDIDKSQDLTVAPDFETSARAGFVTDYRYRWSRQTQGYLNGSYFNESWRGTPETEPSGKDTPENRWSVLGRHLQQVTDGGQLFGDLFLVSDPLFLREMNAYTFEPWRTPGARTLPFTRSSGGFVQLWDRAALKAQATYYQTLTDVESTTLNGSVPTTQSQILQRVPEVDAVGEIGLGQYLVGEMQASTGDFQRSRGVSGLRFDLEPGLLAPLPLGQRFFGSVRASVRETAYYLTDTMQTFADPGKELDRTSSRETLQLRGDVGTAVSRIYSVNPSAWFGLEKIKHTIEPSAEYLYVPAVAQGELPLWDGVDRIERRSLFTYGLTTRLLGKFAATIPPGDPPAPAKNGGPPGGQIRELARFSIAQSVDVSREIDPLQPNRAADPFSDVDLGGRINPSRFFSFRFLTNYDSSNNDVSAARFGVFVEDPRAQDESTLRRLRTRTSASLSYRFLTQNQLQELDAYTVLRLTDWSGLLYSGRYDVVQNRFLDNLWGLRFVSTCDCWVVDLSVADKTNPQEVEVRAQITLVGLGSGQRQLTRVAPVP